MKRVYTKEGAFEEEIFRRYRQMYEDQNNLFEGRDEVYSCGSPPRFFGGFDEIRARGPGEGREIYAALLRPE